MSIPDKYKAQIDDNSLYDLLYGKRYDQDGEDPPGTVAADLTNIETSAQSIIKQRFGYLPTETEFLNTATVAGVIYLLSRKPGNTINQDQIDQRRQTFFDMLPAQPGSEGRAEMKSQPSKLGEWP